MPMYLLLSQLFLFLSQSVQENVIDENTAWDTAEAPASAV